MKSRAERDHRYQQSAKGRARSAHYERTEKGHARFRFACAKIFEKIPIRQHVMRSKIEADWEAIEAKKETHK